MRYFLISLLLSVSSYLEEGIFAISDTSYLDDYPIDYGTTADFSSVKQLVATQESNFMVLSVEGGLCEYVKESST